MGRKVGHLVVILLLRVDRTSGNAKQILSQRYRPTLLPIFIDQTSHQPYTQRMVSPRNLENLRKRSAHNARHVYWVLRNVTDPEAVDSVLRLASTVQWFEDDVEANPPYNKMNFMRGCPSWQRRACLFRTFFQAPYSILWLFFFRHSCGQNFLSPTSSQRALSDSRKLGKQTVLPKKELRLLTNLRILRPGYRESRKLD